MDTPVTYYPSPIASARAELSKEVAATFTVLLGILATPDDQPNVTLVIRNLAAAFLTYAGRLTFVKDSFSQRVSDIRRLHDELNCLIGSDITPSCHLNGRLSEFPAWRLGLEVKIWHSQILTALGAEVVHACLFSVQLNTNYCKHLSTDLKFLSSPEACDALDEEDLAQLDFGKKWMAHFDRVNKLIKKLVQHPGPDNNNTERKNGSAAALAIQQHIFNQINYPSMKQRGAALNHRNVSSNQFAAITMELKARVEKGCPDAACIVMQILTSLTLDLALNLPLQRDSHQYWTGCVNVEDSMIELNLDSIFPNMRRPKSASQHLFEPSGSTLRSPLPEFMAIFLKCALLRNPGAKCVGDLLNWPKVDVRANLLPDAPALILPSVARAAQTLGVNAMAMGLPRTLAATLSWNFSLIPSARIYYFRLTKEDVSCTWSNYLGRLGWNVASVTNEALVSSGSLCCLTHVAIASIFLHLTQQVERTYPGRRAGLDRLIQHHNSYSIYVAALVSFCCGLRARKCYQICADDWGTETHFSLLNDKRSGRRKNDRPVVLCAIVRAAIGHWRAHCAGFSARMERLTTSNDMAALKQQFANIVAKAHVPLLFIIRDNKPIPLGSSQVWGKLPTDLSAPPNCGRVYWLNVLSSRGFQSGELDVFMRHSVPGLETNASTHPFPLGPTLNRIAAVQDAQLATLIPALLTGLRRA